MKKRLSSLRLLGLGGATLAAMTGAVSVLSPYQVIAQEPPPPPPPPDAPPVENIDDFIPPPPPPEEPPMENYIDNSTPSAPSAPRASTPRPSSPAPARKVPPGQELVSIDFPEPTAIKDIIKTVGQWTGKNFILPPNVAAKVQIISPQQMTKEEAYQAFLSALNVAGFTTVDSGKVVKIVPKASASGSNIKTFYGSGWAPMTDEIITQIIPLNYIDAQTVSSQLQRILRESNVVPFATTNSLIVSDTGHKIRRLIEIIKLLDVKGNQPQVALIPIKHTDAQEMSKKVQDVFGGRGGSGALYLQKVIIDERSNSLLLIGPPRGLNDVVRLIRRLDKPLDDQASQAQIHVRPLDYADAEKLGATLQALAQGGGLRFGNRAGTAARPANAAPAPVSAVDIGGLKITADKATNSLLVQGSKAAFRELDTIIKQLDKRRDQVYVECDIIDVDVSNDMQLGMSVFAGANGPNNKFSLPFGWQPLGMAPFAVNLGETSNSEKLNVVKAIPNTAILGVLGGTSVNVGGVELSPGAFLFAMKQDSNSNVLQTPSLLVSDNEDANFDATEQENIVLNNQDPVTKTTSQKIERLDASLNLKLKPQISRADFVTMTLTVKAESFGRRDADGRPLQTNKRSSQSQVVVQNGQTIVLSGLNRDIEIDAKSKVPLLGDIPILGWLFRSTNTVKKKTNLTVFITPTIVRDSSDLAKIYENKVKARNEFLRAFYGNSFADKESFKRMPGLDRAQVPPLRVTPTPEPEVQSTPGASNNSDEGDMIFPTDDPNPIVAPSSGGGLGGSSIPPSSAIEPGFDPAAAPPPPPPPPPDVPEP